MSEYSQEERIALKSMLRNPPLMSGLQKFWEERAAHALEVQDEEASKENPSVMQIVRLTAERVVYREMSTEIELEVKGWTQQRS